MFSETDIQRFRAKVMMIPFSDCHYWAGAADQHGYGRIGVEGKTWLSHRFSYALEKGDPGALHVRHKCDQPNCVNPAHLELGTHADNMRDMALRGRQPKGPAAFNAKLTAADAVAIVREMVAGTSYEALSKRFGVSKPTLAAVRSGRYYTDETEKERESLPVARHGNKYSNEQVLSVHRAYRLGGRTYQEIADEFGVKRQFVVDVVLGRTHSALTGERG